MGKDDKFNQAIELIKQRKPNEALEILNKLIKLDTKNATFYSERGVAFFHLGKKKESLLDMDMAITLEPYKSYRYSSRAYIRGHYNMINEAISDYKKAIELDPEDAIAYNNLGLLEEQLGYLEKAKKNFSKADSLTESLSNGKHGRKEMNISGEEIKPTNLQKEIDLEKEQKGIWNEIKNLCSSKGRKSFIKFILSGYKKLE